MYNKNLEIKGSSAVDLALDKIQNKEEWEASVLERQGGYNLGDKTIS